VKVARGLSFEVDDDEVSRGQQDLSEVIVAVISRAKRGDPPAAKLAEPRAQRTIEPLELLGIDLEPVRQLGGAQHRDRLAELGLEAADPCTERFGVERLRRE